SKSQHSHSVHQQNIISALGGIPHDFDFDFQSATETPTVYSSRRSSIYSLDSVSGPRLGPNHHVYAYYQTSNQVDSERHHHHHHHNNQCCHNVNCKQHKSKRNSSDSYNPRRSFTGFKLWLRLTWVK
ncbi:14093_t:CDS:1, partial [Acaulospora morrowiae]